jgi:hypothetical protein
MPKPFFRKYMSGVCEVSSELSSSPSSLLSANPFGAHLLGVP